MPALYRLLVKIRRRASGFRRVSDGRGRPRTDLERGPETDLVARQPPGPRWGPAIPRRPHPQGTSPALRVHARGPFLDPLPDPQTGGLCPTLECCRELEVWLCPGFCADSYVCLGIWVSLGSLPNSNRACGCRGKPLRCTIGGLGPPEGPRRPPAWACRIPAPRSISQAAVNHTFKCKAIP